MKALTLWQPWASLVAVGAKTIETRSWRTSYRGRLAIHAAKAASVEAGAFLLSHECWSALWPDRRALDAPHLVRGAVIATCELVDCVPTDRDTMHDFARLGGNEVTDDSDCYIVTYGDEHGEYGGPNYNGRTWDLRKNWPLGDFSDDRWLWLLADVEPLAEPVPARGRQQLWEWTP